MRKQRNKFQIGVIVSILNEYVPKTFTLSVKNQLLYLKYNSMMRDEGLCPRLGPGTSLAVYVTSYSPTLRL